MKREGERFIPASCVPFCRIDKMLAKIIGDRQAAVFAELWFLSQRDGSLLAFQDGMRFVHAPPAEIELSLRYLSLSTVKRMLKDLVEDGLVVQAAEDPRASEFPWYAVSTDAANRTHPMGRMPRLGPPPVAADVRLFLKSRDEANEPAAQQGQIEPVAGPEPAIQQAQNDPVAPIRTDAKQGQIDPLRRSDCTSKRFSLTLCSIDKKEEVEEEEGTEFACAASSDLPEKNKSNRIELGPVARKEREHVEAAGEEESGRGEMQEALAALKAMKVTDAQKLLDAHSDAPRRCLVAIDNHQRLLAAGYRFTKPKKNWIIGCLKREQVKHSGTVITEMVNGQDAAKCRDVEAGGDEAEIKRLNAELAKLSQAEWDQLMDTADENLKKRGRPKIARSRTNPHSLLAARVLKFGKAEALGQGGTS